MIKKITNKDKKDWKKFLDSNSKLENKDIIFNKINKNEKVKKVYDTWKFSREVKSLNPNWLLTDTQA